ncbi:MAG: glycosyltransferase family 2 protein [Gaiellales bacterium]
MSARLAVAIVAHGNRELLLEALTALAGPGRPQTEHTVHVLDNASEDGTCAAVRERFPDVDLVEQDHRDGFGANHNRLLARSDAPHHLILNDDATVEPGAIDLLVAHLGAHPEVAVAAPRITYPDGRHQPSAFRFPDPATCLRSLATLGQAGVEQRVDGAPAAVDWASGCALLLRRSAVELTGPFDEGFYMFSEETDLQRRLSDRWFATHVVPQAVVRHHVRASTGGDPSRRIVEFWRSRRRYWAKHHPGVSGDAARLALAGQYAALSGLSRLSALPGPLRRLAPGLPRTELDLHIRNALEGPTGPGLRESADAWNAAHGVHR